MSEPFTVEERRPVCADAECELCDGTGLRARADARRGKSSGGKVHPLVRVRLELCSCVHSIVTRSFP